MRYLLRREMMSAAASISTALRSQIKLDSRFWPAGEVRRRPLLRRC